MSVKSAGSSGYADTVADRLVNFILCQGVVQGVISKTFNTEKVSEGQFAAAAVLSLGVFANYAMKENRDLRNVFKVQFENGDMDLETFLSLTIFLIGAARSVEKLRDIAIALKQEEGHC